MEDALEQVRAAPSKRKEGILPVLPAEKGVGLAQDEQGGDPSPAKPVGQHSYETGWWRLKPKMENPLNACSQAVKT